MDEVPCSMTMLVNGGEDPNLALRSVPKGPSQFPNVFLITTQLDALKLIDKPTFW